MSLCVQTMVAIETRIIPKENDTIVSFEYPLFTISAFVYITTPAHIAPISSLFLISHLLFLGFSTLRQLHLASHFEITNVSDDLIFTWSKNGDFKLLK